MQANSDKASDERNDAARQSACAVGGATAFIIYIVKDLKIGDLVLSKGSWVLPVVAVTMLTYAAAEEVSDSDSAKMDWDENYSDASLVGEMVEEF